MPGTPGRHGRLLIGMTDVTGQLSSLGMELVADQIDDSVMAPAKEFLSAQAMYSLNASGRWTKDAGSLRDRAQAMFAGNTGKWIAGRVGKDVWLQGTVINTTFNVDETTSSRVGVAGAWVYSKDDFIGDGLQLLEHKFTATTKQTGAVVDLGENKASATRKVLVYITDSSNTKAGGTVQLFSGATLAGNKAKVGSDMTYSAQEAGNAITAEKPIELEVTGAVSRYARVDFQPTGAGTSGTVIIVVAGLL